MAKGLTAIQGRVLDFVVSTIEGRHFGPTVAELRAEFGFRANRGATVHLDALEAKGYIVRGARSGITVKRLSSGAAVRLRFTEVGSDE